VSELRRHWPRIAITLLPLLLALAHATGAWPLSALERLDRLIYDIRLRATMPRTLETRVVIVDVDDASLARQGQWPWPRDKMAGLTTELLTRQQAAVLGFDVMFLEPDRSSGLDRLRALASGPLKGMSGLASEVERLAPTLDHDATFAEALRGRPVALGYYFTRTQPPRAKGLLPTAPTVPSDSFPAERTYGTAGTASAPACRRWRRPRRRRVFSTPWSVPAATA
jgi:adenylate cyclase